MKTHKNISVTVGAAVLAVYEHATLACPLSRRLIRPMHGFEGNSGPPSTSQHHTDTLLTVAEPYVHGWTYPSSRHDVESRPLMVTASLKPSSRRTVRPKTASLGSTSIHIHVLLRNAAVSTVAVDTRVSFYPWRSHICHVNT